MTHALPPSPTRPPPEGGGEAVPMVRVATPRGAPRLAAAMWVAASFVAIAILKPWGGAGPIAPTLRPDVVVSVEITPVPTEDRSATGLAAPVCLGTGGWRIATLETWHQREVRVWRAIEPIPRAAGPLDPAIPSVPVVADELAGLGWCAPAFGPEQPVGPAAVRAWQVTGGVARVLSLRQVQPEDGVTPIAALYVPSGGRWTSGLIVFAYRDAGTGSVAWFAAELEVLAPAVTGPPDPPSATPESR